MRRSTALAIRRAGEALQDAILEARTDSECHALAKLHLSQLGRTAGILADVPIPPGPAVEEPPGEVTWRTCTCGQRRILTQLSPPCPSCGTREAIRVL